MSVLGWCMSMRISLPSALTLTWVTLCAQDAFSRNAGSVSMACTAAGGAAYLTECVIFMRSSWPMSRATCHCFAMPRWTAHRWIAAAVLGVALLVSGCSEEAKPLPPQQVSEPTPTATVGPGKDRKSVVWGTSVSVGEVLGGWRTVKKTIQTIKQN